MKSVHSEPQYHITITERIGRRAPTVIGDQAIDDPFIRTTIVVGKTWWERLQAAWKAWRGMEFQIRVDGTVPAVRAVFMSDYTPPKPIAEEYLRAQPEPETSPT